MKTLLIMKSSAVKTRFLRNTFLYVDCSKSIQRDFFPRKLMKHGRCAMVWRWRVPSCTYVDVFAPADSVSRMQPACEWECICSMCRIVIFCENDDSALVSGSYL